MSNDGRSMTALLAFTLMVLIILDLLVALYGKADNTISAVMHDLTKHYPVIILAAGIVLGHIFRGDGDMDSSTLRQFGCRVSILILGVLLGFTLWRR